MSSFREKTSTSLEKLGYFLMDGRSNVTILATLAAAIPFMGWLSLILVCLVTLRKGAREGLFILLWAILPAMVSGYWLGSWSIAIEVLLSYLVLWGLACVLRFSASWRWVLEVSLLIAVAIIMIFHWQMPDLNSIYLEYFMGLYQANHPSPEAYTQMQHSLQHWLHYLLGIQMSLYMLHNLLCLVIARGIQARLYNPLGLTRDLKLVRLGWLTWGLAAVLLLLSVGLSQTWALDCFPVILTTAALGGLSLMHCYLRIKLPYKGILFLFYLIFTLFLPFSLIPAVMIALLDTAWNFREKICVKKIEQY